MKKFMAAVMAGIMVVSVVGCKKLEAVDDDDFIEAVCEEFDIDEDDIFDIDEDDYRDIWYYDDGEDVFVDMYIFEDEDDADEEFEEWKEEVDEDLSGTHRSVSNGSSEYVVFDGEMEDEDVYGGVYRVDENVYIIFTNDDSKSSKGAVDSLCEALGFPHP